jgi:hypothetical protein
MATQQDNDFWRGVRNGIQAALEARAITAAPKDVSLITRFALEEIERRGYRLVPVKPTREMQDAVKHAMDKGRRQSISWVSAKLKNRWRFLAVVDAAPQWRNGYIAENGHPIEGTSNTNNSRRDVDEER